MTTDFHSHILPGIDDGSSSLQMSVAMLRAMARQGITRVVATPHFYAHRDTPQAFLERRNRALQQLQQALEGEKDLPRIIPAAEVYYFAGMSASESLPSLTIGHTPYVLVEMPEAPWTRSMYRELENIRIRQGLIPVIAHIDRYITPTRQHGIPAALENMDVLIQANAGFFLDWRKRRLAFKLLQRDGIHLLGSDCHDLTDRPPNLDRAMAAIERKLGKAPLERIGQYEAYILD